MRVQLLNPVKTDAETAAAAEWLRARDWELQLVDLDETISATSDSVLWIHARTVSTTPAQNLALREYVRQGGSLLLSQGGAALSGELADAPEAVSLARVVWSDASDPLWSADFTDWPEYPHVRGIQGWGPHPLFDGFQRGTFTWRPSNGEDVIGVRCNTARMARVRAVGVERAYVQLDCQSVVAWEHVTVTGRLLCVGAFVSLTSPDGALQPQRDRLLENALRYVAARQAPRPHDSIYWPQAGSATVETESLSPREIPSLRDTPREELVIESWAIPDAPFNLAGEQALVTGSERHGVRDIWIHPLGVATGGLELRVGGAACDRVKFTISPSQAVREMEFAGFRIVERIVPARHAPFVIIDYRTASGDGCPQGTVIRSALPLRLQWPMPPDVLQPLRVRMLSDDVGNHQIVVNSADELSGACVEVSGARQVDVRSDDRSPEVEIDASASTHVRLMVHRLRAPLSSAYDTPPDADEIASAADVRRSHSERLANSTTRLESSDPCLDPAFAWAKQRLSMFEAASPGVGRGLMAGYASSRNGWGFSRAGYSWFFGRDACWSGDALLAAGMHEEAFAALEFLAATRDVTGKILHEATTSGVVHYDAADATPLFLRYVAAFAEWTADKSRLDAIWPAVTEGVAFVASTDGDGDGLPDNTGIGHGWLEMGPLGGGAVTSYVAAVWIDALRRIGPVAEWLGDAKFATLCRHLADRASAAVEQRLRHPGTGRLALQLMVDGTRVDDLSALSAVPIALGVDEHPSGDEVVRELGSPRFCAPWGVRLLSVDDPRYRPDAYHNGTVWPLYTGWLALAAYARHHRSLGARLVRANAELHLQREKGAFDEVLRGDDGQAAGVCANQAWSAAMAITPVVHGMWGVKADAMHGCVVISPQLPDEWKYAALRDLRVGAARFDVVAERRATGEVASIRVAHREGPKLDVILGSAS